jgi:hypothetical protein
LCSALPITLVVVPEECQSMPCFDRVALPNRSHDLTLREDQSTEAGHRSGASLLKDLSAGVSGRICYQSREDEGSQSPTQTLDRG